MKEFSSLKTREGEGRGGEGRWKDSRAVDGTAGQNHECVEILEQKELGQRLPLVILKANNSFRREGLLSHVTPELWRSSQNSIKCFQPFTN